MNLRGLLATLCMLMSNELSVDCQLVELQISFLIDNRLASREDAAGSSSGHREGFALADYGNTETRLGVLG